MGHNGYQADRDELCSNYHSSTVAPAVAVRVAFRILSRFNREDLGNAIEVLVDLLNSWGGDADLELSGDEQDHDSAEDEICDYGFNGPSCPIADPDCAVDDGACDPDGDSDTDEPIPDGGSGH